jgi:hypothetical protein
MSRGDAAFKAAAEAEVVHPAIFVQLKFDEGDFNVWTGLGEKALGGEGTFQGVGGLMEVGEFIESTDTEATDITLKLNGIPSDFLIDVMGSAYQGREAKIFLALYSSDGALLSYVTMFRGRMSTLTIQDSGGDITVEAILQSSLTNLLRPSEKRFTDSDLRSRFSDDAGLAYISTIKDIQIKWK